MRTDLFDKLKQRTYAVASRETIMDKVIFSIIFFIGSCLIIVLKLYNYKPIWVALWPALLISLYLAAAWFMGRIHIEAEAVGDNCYYLGFLFTLVSLATTLYLIVSQEANGMQDAEMRNIVSGFGIALSSTIVGILLRVILSRMQSDTFTHNKEIQEEINRAMRQFRNQLRENIGGQRRFATETAQFLTEQREDMRKIFIDTAQAHKEALAKGIRDIQNFYAKTGETLSEQHETFAQVVKANEVVHRQFQQQVELMCQGTETVSKSVENLASIANESAKIQAALAGLAGHLDSTSTSFSRHIIPAAAEFQNMITEAVKVLTNSIQDLTSSTSHLHNTKKRTAEELTRVANALRQDTAKAADTLIKSNAALIETTEKLYEAALHTGPKGSWILSAWRRILRITLHVRQKCVMDAIKIQRRILMIVRQILIKRF